MKMVDLPDAIRRKMHLLATPHSIDRRVKEEALQRSRKVVAGKLREAIAGGVDPEAEGLVTALALIDNTLNIHYFNRG